MSRETARYNYTDGSRAGGVISYDDDTKITIHNDTSPARGSHSAFDLVRLSKFGHMDKDSGGLPMTQRPSYKAMIDFAEDLPELRAARAAEELVALDPLPVADDAWLDIGAPRPIDDTVARFMPRPPGEFTSGPPQDWLIRDVLPQAGLVVIYGESGSGKTFLTLDMVAALTRGVPWIGKRTKQCAVTYICAEGAGGFRNRLRAYAQGHGVAIQTLPWVIADSPYFLSVEHPAAVIKGMQATEQTGVVVIDVLAAVMPGGNENSGEDMGKVLDYCKLVHRQTGALVVLIHHSGKDASRGARGWSGLRAAADAEIEVTRSGEYRAWSTSKMRDGSDDVKGAFKLKILPLGVNKYNEQESSCVIEHVEIAPAAAPHRTGKHDRVMLRALDASVVSPTPCTAWYEAAAKLMPRGAGKRDRRTYTAKEAGELLIARGVVELVEEGNAVQRFIRRADESSTPFDDVVTNLGEAATLASSKGETIQ